MTKWEAVESEAEGENLALASWIPARFPDRRAAQMQSRKQDQSNPNERTHLENAKLAADCFEQSQ